VLWGDGARVPGLAVTRLGRQSQRLIIGLLSAAVGLGLGLAAKAVGAPAWVGLLILIAAITGGEWIRQHFARGANPQPADGVR
jgi:hypothetical protein